MGGDGGGQGAVPGGPVRVVAQRADERGDAAATGVLEAGGGPVGSHGDDLGGVGRVLRRVEQRGAERAGAGDEDDDPRPRRRSPGAAHAATL